MLFDALPMVKSESVETIKIDTTEPENEPSSKKAQYHRDPSDWELEPVAVTKSYRNQDFLNSSHARSLRIMCEQEETMQRLAANGVRATIQFFGSARARDRHQFDKAMAETVAKLDAAAPESDAHTDVLPLRLEPTTSGAVLLTRSVVTSTARYPPHRQRSASRSSSRSNGWCPTWRASRSSRAE
eukprot:1966518-Prymnesium_polylepis.1